MRHRRKNRSTSWTGKVRSVDVGEKLRLIPYWERGMHASDRIPIIVDPGPAFGAGDHPTTLMALELLEVAVAELAGRAPAMLDVGTGTGALAIAGKTLGTGLTVGIDIDPAAVFTARRNIRLNLPAEHNSPDRVSVVIGDAECIKGSFDIVAANLAAPLLMRLRDTLERKTERFLVLSGIADELIDALLAAYGSSDLEVMRRRRMDGWNAALLKR